jgi:hypothetical protein
VGYETIDAPFTAQGWFGLERSFSNSGNTFLDGSSNSWWYSVGTKVKWENWEVPGPAVRVSKVELYVKVPKSPCDDPCEYNDSGNAACRSRILWVQNNDGSTLNDAMARVNSECTGQCTCTEADLGITESPTSSPTESPTDSPTSTTDSPTAVPTKSPTEPVCDWFLTNDYSDGEHMIGYDGYTADSCIAAALADGCSIANIGSDGDCWCQFGTISDGYDACATLPSDGFGDYCACQVQPACTCQFQQNAGWGATIPESGNFGWCEYASSVRDRCPNCCDMPLPTTEPTVSPTVSPTLPAGFMHTHIMHTYIHTYVHTHMHTYAT